MKSTPEEIAERYVREVMELEDQAQGCDLAQVSSVCPVHFCCQWQARVMWCDECRSLRGGFVKIIADAIREALAIERQANE